MDLKTKLRRFTDSPHPAEEPAPFAGEEPAPFAGEEPASVSTEEPASGPSQGSSAGDTSALGIWGEGPDGKRQRIERLRSMIAQVMERDGFMDAEEVDSEAVESAAAAPSWDGLVGKELQTEHGSVHVIEQLLEPDHHHGKVPVRCALASDPSIVAELALDSAMSEVDVERLLILDTETTGLSGGTGTVPFLVGLAWFEDGVLRLEQLLLKGFGQEVPLLHRLSQRLASASCLVTYNGKSFDWPLLRTRFVMNRVAAPPVPAHLDLLHCARRVLKPRIKELRLVDVEMQLLGFYREGDVDGSEIPGIYLRFLRGADPATLCPVLEHNANDLIALASIMGRLAQHFESVQPADDPRDHLAYAKLAARAKDQDRAMRFAHAAACGGGGDEVSVDAFMLTARLARRKGDPQAASEALHQALEAAFDDTTESQIHLALAKLYEHQLRDLERALHHARRTVEAEGEEPQARRLARLERRLREK